MNRNDSNLLILPDTFPIFARFDGHITVNTKAFQEDPEGEIARAIKAGAAKVDVKHGYVPAIANHDDKDNELDVEYEIDF